ncbi:hypothetical protein RDWZM_002874 [Blomia tropicalis]|uniref:Uncharacterized protein n=1 Tax=Blomia tropicalis TaxID=40697 RepID=A0A9Q0MEY7_BLOTA|nr:hypothetical protein RDWZM_002874 [Blomia tropicalis]
MSRVSPPSTVYFNYRQIKSESYSSLNNYPTPGHPIAPKTIMNANPYNTTFGNYCPNSAQSSSIVNDGTATATEPSSLHSPNTTTTPPKMTSIGYEYLTDYTKNCDYNGSKLSGNMSSDSNELRTVHGQSYYCGTDNNGQLNNGNLSSPEHYNHGTNDGSIQSQPYYCGENGQFNGQLSWTEHYNCGAGGGVGGTSQLYYGENGQFNGHHLSWPEHYNGGSGGGGGGGGGGGNVIAPGSMGTTSSYYCDNGQLSSPEHYNMGNGVGSGGVVPTQYSSTYHPVHTYTF